MASGRARTRSCWKLTGDPNFGLFLPARLGVRQVFGCCTPRAVPIFGCGVGARKRSGSPGAAEASASDVGGRHDGAMVAQHAFAVSNSSGPVAGSAAVPVPAYGRDRIAAGIGCGPPLKTPGWQWQPLQARSGQGLAKVWPSSGQFWPVLAAVAGMAAPALQIRGHIRPWHLGCGLKFHLAHDVSEQLGLATREIAHRWG
jgi:hypothetical protein